MHSISENVDERPRGASSIRIITGANVADFLKEYCDENLE
jgi:hypothetical protein